ncbi:thiolase family protein [Mycobacterium sp. 050128]|uniref:thiolase family protein n=1 Tax=Mycobacterium sp. 050128 TaxID=3096112 RepID=UPI002EDA1288
MPEAVIVDAVRTPIGKRNGSLADVHPVDLSAQVLRALQRRTGIDASVVDDVIWGCVNQVGDQAAQIGRYSVLAAGWPEAIPALTVNRACGSSQSAVDFAAGLIRSGHYDVVVAGGVESMNRVPLGAGRELGRPFGPLVRSRYKSDLESGIFPNGDFNQGVGAELIAKQWGLSRRALDDYSVRSHELAAAAIDRGAFASQLAVLPDKPDFVTDEGVRRGTSVETLAGLKPSFQADGVIHAGNASQISDGASATLITTPQKARELGLIPIVRYHAGAVAGSDPVQMLTAPIPATEKLLRRTGLTISDIGVFEVNEAFASVPLAWQANFGVNDRVLNPLGGAIAVGHPLGASGTVLMTKMIHHMRDKGIRYGLQTMCEGGGTANATLVELV